MRGGLSAGCRPGLEFRIVLFGALRSESGGTEHPTVLELTARTGSVLQGGAGVLFLDGVAAAQGLFDAAPCRGRATLRLVRQPGASLALDILPTTGEVLRLAAEARLRPRNPVFSASSYSTTVSDLAGRALARGELRLDFRHEKRAIILSFRLRKPERARRGGIA